MACSAASKLGLHSLCLSSKCVSSLTRAPHACASAWLQWLLENPELKKGHKFVKKNFRVNFPSGMGSPFDSKQLGLDWA